MEPTIKREELTLERTRQGFKKERLYRVDFSGLDLYRADFSDTVLEDCNFQGAQLREALFIGADISDCDFTGADLDGAVFLFADIEVSDFTGASINRVAGDGEVFQSLQVSFRVSVWPVVYCRQTGQLAIGCQQHHVRDWMRFTDNEIRIMSPLAPDWWKKWKPLLIEIFELQWAVKEETIETEKENNE